MPIDWEELRQIIEGAADDAADATDERFAEKISSLTRMTDQEVQELFPVKADVEKLAQLMEIVKSAEDRNDKVTRIMSGGEKFGGVILTLLDKLV